MDYYRSIDTGGSCSSQLSSIVGAYASMLRTETYCTGGSCNDSGTLLYQTTYHYDEHRRPCLVESVNGAGDVIRSSRYRYDQFDNVVHEESSSDIDLSHDSNYQIDYAYDGLLRLIEETRCTAAGSPQCPTDGDDNLIKRTTYAYDAASNLTMKVEEEPLVGEPPPPTEPLVTPTSPPPPTAAADDVDGCQIGGRSGIAWPLLVPIALVALLRRRWCSTAAIHWMTIGAIALSSAVASARTTVTTYRYNPDGALTAITTQVDDETP